LIGELLGKGGAAQGQEYEQITQQGPSPKGPPTGGDILKRLFESQSATADLLNKRLLGAYLTKRPFRAWFLRGCYSSLQSLHFFGHVTLRE
jgi:hypothetical protein